MLLEFYALWKKLFSPQPKVEYVLQINVLIQTS